MIMVKRRGSIAILFALWCVFQSNFLYGNINNTIIINGNTSVINFAYRVKFFVDKAQKYTISSLGEEEFNRQFINYYDGKYYKGGNIWAKFFVQNERKKSQEYILEVGGFKEVQVFYKASYSSAFSNKTTGRYIAYPKNELGDFHFQINKVKVVLEPETLYEFILYYPDPRIEKIRLEFSLFSVDNWSHKIFKIESERNLLLGLFFGVCFVLAIINFVYFFIQKDKAYINYSIYIVTLIYYMASVYGLVDYTSLINFPILYLPLENVSLILSVICYLLFLKTFINTKIRYPFWNNVTNYLIGVLLTNIVISSWIFIVSGLPETAILTRNIVLLIALPFFAAFLISIYKRANKVDHIFIVGSAVLLATGVISLLTHIFMLYDNPDLLFQIGVIIELIIFNIGLGVKSRFNEKEKQLAQSNLIYQLHENERLQLSINQDLEYQVNDRTKKIQSQNNELLQQQEELETHRDALEEQNKVIAQSMNELESIKSQLELIVEERTHQLQSANQELVQYNNQLEQYAYITAHNLRAPVARLKGLMYIFEKTSGVDKQNNDVIRKIVNSAHEMDEVLSDMNSILELKNKNDGQSHEVDIKVIVDKVRKILFDNLQEAKAEMELNLDVQHVNANIPYLESIVYNLVSNSIKYRSKTRKLKIAISSFSENSNVILEISDNGMGIDLSKFERKIFGLYQRFHDHVGGKGLGLYLVKTQVEALGGNIEMESEVNKGTTFKISLPI